MQETSTKRIVGRYAPSPTGVLHLGNLRTALLAWLQVRLQGGRFLLRIEDLDKPRVVMGSADLILADLRWLGLDWDGEVVYQSQRQDLYLDCFAELRGQNLIYPCFCSRKDIQQAVSAPHVKSVVYPQTCRYLTDQQRQQKAHVKSPAYRLCVPSLNMVFMDQVAGRQKQNLALECGDFVVKRADGLFAYQLAVVVDDVEQGITHILRGADLLDSTARQLFLFDQLNKPKPEYAHVALMYDEMGNRMAKRDGSLSVTQWRQTGRTAEQLVAYLAKSVGLISGNEALTLNELLNQIDYTSFLRAIKQAPNPV